jgi:hypothetical protein
VGGLLTGGRTGGNGSFGGNLLTGGRTGAVNFRSTSFLGASIIGNG